MLVSPPVSGLENLIAASAPVEERRVRAPPKRGFSPRAGCRLCGERAL